MPLHTLSYTHIDSVFFHDTFMCPNSWVQPWGFQPQATYWVLPPVSSSWIEILRDTYRYIYIYTHVYVHIELLNMILYHRLLLGGGSTQG